MDILKTLAVPQSPEHFHALLFVSALSSLVLLPSMGFALGVTLFSRWMERIGNRMRDADSVSQARFLVDAALPGKGAMAALGLIPGAVVLFSFAQILQLTASPAVGIAGFAFLFLAAALVLLSTYKYTFRLEFLFEAVAKSPVREGETAGSMGEYDRANRRAHEASGRWGVTALVVAAFLYCAAGAVAADPGLWDSADTLPGMLLSGEVWLRFLLFLVVAGGMTGSGVFFFESQWRRTGRMKDGLSPVVRRAAMRCAIGSLCALPPVVIVGMMVVPAGALSGWMYVLASLAVTCAFLAAHFLYFHTEESVRQAAAAAFVLFVAGAGTFVVGDHVAFATSSRSLAVQQASQSAKALEDLQASLGFAPPSETGEDIYNARCSACHLFDQKKIGPPYFETIPKYKGKKDALMAFILNPVKKDPRYPPMPNQGLKPAEADSIASYLLRRVGMEGPGK